MSSGRTMFPTCSIFVIVDRMLHAHLVSRAATGQSTVTTLKVATHVEFPFLLRRTIAPKRPTFAGGAALLVLVFICFFVFRVLIQLIFI